MERRNGDEPLAPPRPPKFMPKVHRLRATETPMMSASSHSTNNNNTNTNNILRHTQQLQNSSNINNNTQQRLLHSQPLIHPRTHQNLHQQHLVPQVHQQQIVQTAPLQPVITFSRRRPPPQPLSPIPSLSSNIHNQEQTPVSPVTLAAPRPDNERLVNEYVDTPFRLPHPTSTTTISSRAPTPSISSSSISQSTTTGTTTTTTLSSSLHSSGRNSPKSQIVPHNQITSSSTNTIHSTGISSRTVRPTALPISTIITKQPLSSFTKESGGLHEDVDLHPTHGDSLNTVLCPQCRKCRCQGCQNPRQLPSRWVCGKSCLCSAESIIDYTSCLCCVKALYYHCAKDQELGRDDDSTTCADDTCSCSPHNCVARWSCLAALSICLPCLWCYWPMRGCVALCADCYARWHSRHGCNCKNKNSIGIPNTATLSTSSSAATVATTNSVLHRTINHHHHHHHHNHRTTNELTPEKRLLDSSPEF